jgi:hypothetical protein
MKSHLGSAGSSLAVIEKRGTTRRPSNQAGV